MILPLYIDPGTGSMIFSLFIGLAAAGTFALRTVFLKLRFLVSGGRAKSMDEKNIPFVIFSDHRRYWNVFHSLCDEFESHGVDLTYYTASEDDPVLSASYKFVHAQYLGAKNKPYAKMNLLHADIVVSTTPGLDVYQWKRSRYVKWYVHIPHAVRPLYTYRMFGVDHYDAILCTGENQEVGCKEIEALRPNVSSKEYVIVGSPTMDNLLAQVKKAKDKIINEKPVVLIAPSWGESGILTKYGEKFLDEVAKTDFKIIVRPHPQSRLSEKHILKPLMEKYSQFEWNFDNDNFSVLNKADILISDFSGTMFDFAFAFEQPVIYMDSVFDPAPYDAAWLDKPIWEFNVLQKIGAKMTESDFPNLQEFISSVLKNANFKQNLKDVRAECWANEGKSAEAIFNYLISKTETSYEGDEK